MPVKLDDFIVELQARIRSMTPQTRTYRTLRNELSKLGYWKRKPRGNPKLGYARMKAKKAKVA